MENASKALIIAGGTLLALMVVAVLFMVIKSTGYNLRQQDRAVASEQLSKFNMKYESYDKNVRGIDIRSLINMADDDNSKDSRQITIKFFVAKDLSGTAQAGGVGSDISDLAPLEKWYSNIATSSGIGSKTNPYALNQIEGDATMLTNFNKRVFDCISSETTYDSDGRISGMVFEEIY